ncbi:MAG: TonB-dependent receptor [Tannerellaceae bacterium]|jgi:outer membrane receptor protein involved in Fe transport|nr:TonB-dependent receptor [Tannerellaceae bacterium]
MNGKSLFFCLLISVSIHAQQRTASGLTVDSRGEVLPGVNILVKGTTMGLASDHAGRFSFRELPQGAVLRFSYLGYEQQELPAGENMRVILKEDAKTLKEIVVSTQKRNQSSTEVPVAIIALSGDNLTRLDVRQFDELSEYIPGMQMQLQSPNNPGYVIRGVTSDDGDSRSQARVSVFQDGVSISRSRGSAVELFDLERIEVVKGPQGTLFGRGAEIGALHIIRKKPAGKLGGELTMGYGSYNRKLADGFINTPITGDKLLNRFAFTFEDRDGYIKNLSGGDLNGKNVYALRNSTRWFAGEKTMIDLTLDYQHDNYPGTSFKNGQYSPAGGDTSPHTMADLEQGKNLYIKRNTGGAGLFVNHDINGEWKMTSISGFRMFDSDESFDADGTASPLMWVSEIAKGKQFSQELRFNYSNNHNLTGFAGASYFYEDNSQEVPLRINEQALYTAYTSKLLKEMLASQFGATGLPAEQIAAIANILFPDTPALSNGTFNYTTHLPDIRLTLEQVFSQQIGIPLTLEQLFAVLPADTRQMLIGTVDLLSNHPINAYHEEMYRNEAANHAAELFADATWQITKQLGLTAGIRLSYEHQWGAYEAAASAQPSIFGQLTNGSPNLLSAVSNGKVADSKEYYSSVMRAALNYMIKRNNLYVSVSRGRRPGVVFVLPEETTFLSPETIWSYEAGIKGVAPGGKLNYDLAAFYYDWSHFQSSSLRSREGSLLPEYQPNDAGKAHSLGVEASLRYALLPRLNLTGTYAYINGKFNDKDEDGNEQEYAGHRFRLTPEHSFSFGLDFTCPLKGGHVIYVRPAYSYKSKVYFEDSNDELLTQKGFGLLNGTTGIRFHPKRGNIYLEVGLYGKNILNEKYIIDAGNSGNTIGFPTFIAGNPAVFGAQIKIGF